MGKLRLKQWSRHKVRWFTCLSQWFTGVSHWSTPGIAVVKMQKNLVHSPRTVVRTHRPWVKIHRALFQTRSPSVQIHRVWVNFDLNPVLAHPAEVKLRLHLLLPI